MVPRNVTDYDLGYPGTYSTRTGGNHRKILDYDLVVPGNIPEYELVVPGDIPDY